MAAQSLWHSRSFLGDYYRKMRARLGPAAANTATAHKLARIVYHLLTTGETYDESVFARSKSVNACAENGDCVKKQPLWASNWCPKRAAFSRSYSEV